MADPGTITDPRCKGTGHIPIENDGATPWRAQHCPDCGATGVIPAPPDSKAPESDTG